MYCVLETMHRIVKFYADAPMRIGESYHPYYEPITAPSFRGWVSWV